MKRCTHRHVKVSQGVTLVELIVGVAIFSLIGLGLIFFQRTVVWTTKTAQTNLVVQQQVRRTLNTFSDELRSAKPSASGAYAIESAGTSSIVFFSNIDTATDTERVRYFLATSSTSTLYDVIKRGIIKPTGTTYNSANESISTIATNIKNTSSTPLLTYFDEGYAGTSTALALPVNISAIRHVQMNIIIQEYVGRGTSTQAYTTRASVRNLKENY